MSFNEWKEYNLDEVYEFASGLSKKASEFGSGFPFLSFKDVFYNYFVPKELENLANTTEKERARCSVIRGDVFLTRTSETLNELGMSCVALKDYANATFNGFTKRLRPKGNIQIHPEYAGYYFRSTRFRHTVTSMSTMTTRASLNNDMLSVLKIIVLPLEEQKAIANILSSLDEKIELNNQMNKTLEEMAQALFKRWFVNFEFPNEDGQPYKSSGGEMVDSELGMIPKGYRLSQIGNVCDVKGGKRLPKGVNLISQKNNHPYIRVRDMNNSEYLLLNSEYDYVDDETQKSISRYIVSEGDVIVSIVGTIGLISKVHKSLEGANLTENCVKLTNFEQVSSEYLYLWLTSRYGQDTIKKMTVGAVQAKLPIKNIQNISILLPTNDGVIEFQKKIESINIQMQFNLEQNQILIELRDTLLPKLMSGEIRVTDLQN